MRVFSLSLLLHSLSIYLSLYLLSGMGLGPNGEALRNVALNLPSLQNQNNLGVGSNNSNAPVPVAPPPSFSSANVLNQTQNPMSNLAALNNVVGNLNNLNPLLSTLGLGSLATNSNDSSNASALDINKMVGAGSSSANAGMNSVVGGGGSGNFSGLSGMGGGLNQSNRLDNSLSNPYSSNNTFSSMSSNMGSGLGSNANSGFVSNQREYDIGSVRNYNSQSDDFGRLPTQNFSSSQLGNGGGSNPNVGGNVRSQNISDTILIRNVSVVKSLQLLFLNPETETLIEIATISIIILINISVFFPQTLTCSCRQIAHGKH